MRNSVFRLSSRGHTEILRFWAQVYLFLWAVANALEQKTCGSCCRWAGAPRTSARGALQPALLACAPHSRTQIPHHWPALPQCLRGRSLQQPLTRVGARPADADAQRAHPVVDVPNGRDRAPRAAQCAVVNTELDVLQASSSSWAPSTCSARHADCLTGEEGLLADGGDPTEVQSRAPLALQRLPSPEPRAHACSALTAPRELCEAHLHAPRARGRRAARTRRSSPRCSSRRSGGCTTSR